MQKQNKSFFWCLVVRWLNNPNFFSVGNLEKKTTILDVHLRSRMETLLVDDMIIQNILKLKINDKIKIKKDWEIETKFKSGEDIVLNICKVLETADRVIERGASHKSFFCTHNQGVLFIAKNEKEGKKLENETLLITVNFKRKAICSLGCAPDGWKNESGEKCVLSRENCFFELK